MSRAMRISSSTYMLSNLCSARRSGCHTEQLLSYVQFDTCELCERVTYATTRDLCHMRGPTRTVRTWHDTGNAHASRQDGSDDRENGTIWSTDKCYRGTCHVIQTPNDAIHKPLSNSPALAEGRQLEGLVIWQSELRAVELERHALVALYLYV